MSDAVDELTRTPGRLPRILHIGNVANNAYLNARLLNTLGIDSDVLCYGNYHFMASPEWEELDDLRTPIADPDRPDWPASSDARFERPRWFAQGPFHLGARYLMARRSGSRARAAVLWQLLEARRALTSSTRLAAVRRLRTQRPQASSGAAPAATDTAEAISAYQQMRAWSVAAMGSLAACYDVVHAYGAEAILPFSAGVHPYVAWEHGTLRQFPFDPGVQGPLIAQAYQHADAVVITNADTRASAERLGITRYRFIPHPINEQRPSAADWQRTRQELLAELSSDFIVFHPSRQHWTAERDPSFEKGNDCLIHGLAEFFRDRPGAAAVFVDWGASVAASRELLRERGIAARVKWIPPQTGMSLARLMLATDVTADQFYLGAFGSTMPRALSLERPVLIYLDEAAHAWCFDQQPPVMNAREPDEIATVLRRAYDDPVARQQLAAQGREWYGRYHSNDVMGDALTALYRDVLQVTAGRSH